MKSEYAELYRRPEWQKKRLEMLNLKNWKCEICGESKAQLHVHHRYYKNGNKPWEYDDNELAVLCETCHNEEHLAKDNNYYAVQLLLNEFRAMGVSDIEMSMLFEEIDYHLCNKKNDGTDILIDGILNKASEYRDRLKK